MTISVTARLRLGAFDLDATFESGSRSVALFGRSGAGKTTIVNIVAGLLRPASGRIAVDGEALFDSARGIDVPCRRRRIGYVFQDALLFPHLSVRHNLFYGRWFSRGRDPAGDPGPVIDLLGIGHLMDRRPPDLSGGERQRVAIGRALLSRPRLLLMDEPLASVDVARRAEVMAWLERLRDETGIPILYVTHSVDEVARLAETVVVLDEGRVAAVGPVADVMSRLDLHPLTGRFEAGSILDAVIGRHDPDWGLSVLTLSGGEIVVPALDLPEGSSVRIRVRARDVALARTAPVGTSVRNSLRGRVLEIQEDGPTFAEVRIDVGGQPLHARVTRASLSDLDLAPGTEVYALVKTVAFGRRDIIPTGDSAAMA